MPDCRRLREQFQALQELKAEFDREFEQAFITKKTAAPQALKTRLEQGLRDMRNNLNFSAEEFFAVILKKHKTGIELTPGELKFMYWIDRKIYRLKGGQRQKLHDIKATRNRKNDYAIIYGVDPSRVIENIIEINELTEVYCGESHEIYFFEPQQDMAEIQKIAKIINLAVGCNNIEQRKKDQLEICNGRLSDNDARFIYKSLRAVGGELSTEANIFNANALLTVGRDLHADSATDFQANSLQTVHGDLIAIRAENFHARALQTVDGIIFLHRLRSADKLILPQSITAEVEFDAMTDEEIEKVRAKYPNLKIKIRKQEDYD